MASFPNRFVRVLPESELSQTGCAAATGLQLTVAYDHVAGLSAEVIAGAFGYEPESLEALAASGDALVMVIAEGAADVGYATDVVLAGLLRSLRPEHGNFSDAQVAEALDSVAGSADLQVQQVQRALQHVFGIRDSLFGQPRFASARWADRRLLAPFYIDEKIDLAAIRTTNNPLRPGTALRLDAYPSTPVVQRLI